MEHPKQSTKRFLITFLLCFFFGVLGVHRFYVGKIKTGILQLITLGGLGIWSFIDLIVIVLGKFKDKEGNLVKMRSKKQVTVKKNVKSISILDYKKSNTTNTIKNVKSTKKEAFIKPEKDFFLELKERKKKEFPSSDHDRYKP